VRNRPASAPAKPAATTRWTRRAQATDISCIRSAGGLASLWIAGRWRPTPAAFPSSRNAVDSSLRLNVRW